MADPGDGGDGRNVGAGNSTTTTRYPVVTDSLDTVFGLLENAHRRYLLYYLFTMERDLAEFDVMMNAIRRYEVGNTDSDDPATPEQIRAELHHVHLPRLANADVIDYDRRQGTVRFTPTPALEEWAEYARYNEIE